MAYARSLDKTFDGLKDMETSQNKKRTSSNVCLVVLEKNKTKVTLQGKIHSYSLDSRL